MSYLMTWLGMGVTAVLLPLVAVTHASEEKLGLDQVPKAVLEAVRSRFADGELTAAAKEMREGKLLYEVTVKQKGRNNDVMLTPEGQILLIEKQISTEDLPEAAARALKETHPKAVYKIVEEMIEVRDKEEKLTCYEVLLVTADEEKLEVKVTAEGEIIKQAQQQSE